MWGYTTTSRSGKTGIAFVAWSVMSVPVHSLKDDLVRVVGDVPPEFRHKSYQPGALPVASLVVRTATMSFIYGAALWYFNHIFDGYLYFSKEHASRHAKQKNNRQCC